MRVLLRLLRYLNRHRGLAALGIGSLAIGLVMQLSVPWMVKVVIDQGIGGRDPMLLLYASLAVVGLTLFQSIFHYGRQYLMETLAQSVVYDLRNDIYRHLQRLSFSYYDQAQTGQLITRVLEDTSVTRQFFSMAIRNVLLLVLMFIGVSIVLISMDWLLALVTLVIMPVVAYVAIVLGVRLRPLFRYVQDRFGAVTAIMQENLSGVRVVRAFARENYEIDRFSAAAMEYNVANMTAIRVWSFRIGLLFFLGEVATVVVLVFGGWRVINGLMTIGTLVAFATYLRMLSEPIRNLGMIINVIARTMASGERIFEILNAKPEIKSPENAIDMTDMRGHVVFDHVAFGYTRARPVLHDLSLEAKPGQVIGLFGLTGSGKSSLTGLMTRFYDVDKGKVLIDGHDVRTVDLDSLRRNVGIVMQETFLFSATLRENIAFGRPDASLEEVVTAAKAAQAHRFISELPDGYDSIIGERGVNLSGGQKQRIAIARALLLNPRILIVDDSTSAVDTETEFQIQQALKQVMQGRTTFIIAQRLLSLRHADAIIVLEKGRVVQRGHHEELLEQPGLYREVYDLQLRDQERMLQVGD